MTRRHVETEIAERTLGHAVAGIQQVYDKSRNIVLESIRHSKPSRRKSR